MGSCLNRARDGLAGIFMSRQDGLAGIRRWARRTIMTMGSPPISMDTLQINVFKPFKPFYSDQYLKAKGITGGTPRPIPFRPRQIHSCKQTGGGKETF